MPFFRPAPRAAATPQSPDPVPPSGPDDVERLFREHNDALLRFVAAKLGSRQEAREIAQEAYVRVLSLDRPEAVSYLQAFLFKTAANLAMDRLRQRARRGAVAGAVTTDAVIFELSPERTVAGAQALRLMAAAIDELPQKCREAFLLYRLDGLSCQEVARRLGIQERMVWRYVARALEHLRLRVNGPEDEA